MSPGRLDLLIHYYSKLTYPLQTSAYQTKYSSVFLSEGKENSCLIELVFFLLTLGNYPGGNGLLNRVE